MVSNRTALMTRRPRSGAGPREGWLRNGVVAGFLATFGMTVVVAVAYGLSNGLGDAGGGAVARWLAALADNPLTRRTVDALILAIALNLVVGLLLAVAYARWLEPALSGPGWRTGMLFALLPWLLSLAIFLPLVGGGFFGVGLGAGPLPILGNLVLHLVYGAILGGVYGLALESGLDGSEADRVNAASAERGAAIGVASGLLMGLPLGWLLAPQLDPDGGRAASTLAVALIGGAVGLAVGSFAGMDKARTVK